LGRGWEDGKGANQEYTSSRGGNTFFPESNCPFKNLFNSKNSRLVTSSLNSFNQLSCSVLISSFNNSFCSSVKVLTQASLLNLMAGKLVLALEVVEAGTFLGAPKNEVMELLALGFLAESERGALLALRFRDMILGLRKSMRRDSLGVCGKVFKRDVGRVEGGWSWS
jgi:hypothetical protein